jgi:hypothetical protein
MRREWPNKRRQLEAAIAQFPDSPYADDIALAIGCGIASYEDDLEGSVKAFREVQKRYPDGKSILSYWWPNSSRWHFDSEWLYRAPGVVQRRRDGSRVARPFGRGTDNLDPRERAALAYFHHLEAWPRHTRDLAQWYIVHALRAAGDESAALQELAKFCELNEDKMAEFNRADREASSRAEGHLILGIMRPCVGAHLELSEMLLAQGKTEDAIAVGKRLVERVSWDGWHWTANKKLGDLYLARNAGAPSKEAQEQYALALNGYWGTIKREVEFAPTYGGTWGNLPLQQWTRTIDKVKQGIQSAGGVFDEKAFDLDRLKEYMSQLEAPAAAKGRRTGAEVPPLAPQLAAAVHSQDLQVLRSYASGGSIEERDAAMRELARTPEGCEALVAMVAEVTQRGQAGMVVAALARARTPHSVAALRQIAYAATDPRLGTEAMEEVLKSMPPDDARKYALGEVLKLAEKPDAEPEKLRFFMKGLRQDEDPPQVRMLRQILRKTQNEQIRTDCLQLLSKWITDASEVREDVLRVLTERAQDDNPRVRADVARAFGQSGDVRRLPILAALLGDQDASVRRAAAAAAGRLLGWKGEIPAGEKEAAAWEADLRGRLKPILEALTRFEEAAAAQRPPAPAPAPAE